MVTPGGWAPGSFTQSLGTSPWHAWEGSCLPQPQPHTISLYGRCVLTQADKSQLELSLPHFPDTWSRRTYWPRLETLLASSSFRCTRTWSPGDDLGGPSLHGPPTKALCPVASRQLLLTAAALTGVSPTDGVTLRKGLILPTGIYVFPAVTQVVGLLRSSAVGSQGLLLLIRSPILSAMGCGEQQDLPLPTGAPMARWAGGSPVYSSKPRRAL